MRTRVPIGDGPIVTECRDTPLNPNAGCLHILATEGSRQLSPPPGALPHHVLKQPWQSRSRDFNRYPHFRTSLCKPGRPTPQVGWPPPKDLLALTASRPFHRLDDMRVRLVASRFDRSKAACDGASSDFRGLSHWQSPPLRGRLPTYRDRPIGSAMCPRVEGYQTPLIRAHGLG